jgi:hypothetical protein
VPFAVELYFDAVLERAVRALWQSLRDAGLPSLADAIGVRPHLSLAVAETLEPAPLIKELERITPAWKRFPVRLAHIGWFPGVAFLGVAPMEPLLVAHAHVWPIIGRYAKERRDHYAPGAWVPHCTLAEAVAPARVAVALASVPLPMDGSIEELGVVDVDPGCATTLARFSLRSP